MNQDRRGERESGESEPHFSRLRSLDTGSSYGEARQSAEGATAAGLPTEGSHSEMAFGPRTRLEPLLIDPQAKECANEAPLPGVRATTAGGRLQTVPLELSRVALPTCQGDNRPGLRSPLNPAVTY